MGMDAGGLGSALQHVLHALGVHMGQHEAHRICRIVGFVRKSVDNPWRNHTCPFDGHTLPACVLQLIGADEHMHGPRGHKDTFVAEHGHQHLFHVPKASRRLPFNDYGVGAVKEVLALLNNVCHSIRRRACVVQWACVLLDSTVLKHHGV
jgi:hypothetical protein